MHEGARPAGAGHGRHDDARARLAALPAARTSPSGWVPGQPATVAAEAWRDQAGRVAAACDGGAQDSRGDLDDGRPDAAPGGEDPAGRLLAAADGDLATDRLGGPGEGAPARWALSRPAAVGLLAVAALASGGAVLATWVGQDRAAGPPLTAAVTSGPGQTVASPVPGVPTALPPVPGAGTAAGGALTPSVADAVSPAGAVAGSPTPARLLVHVAGQVARPGVVSLPAGARVADAVEAAGGATDTADLTRVNLARPVVDGEQVVLLAPGETAPAGVAAPGGAPAPGSAPPGATGGAPAAPLDLNQASVEQLQGLPGVGPVLAQRIVAWRDEHGGFRSVEELQEVSGIGDARFAELAPLLRT